MDQTHTIYRVDDLVMCELYIPCGWKLQLLQNSIMGADLGKHLAIVHARSIEPQNFRSR